ncbi:MAG TPA: MFS transporter [Micromonosporaceae bacterium]|nr:MFS transporter [Micromonosporaceae bacterium]
MRTKQMALVLLCTGVFVVNLDGTVVALALPEIGRDLGGGIAGLQWVIDGYVLAVGCLLVGAGALADTLGRKRVFLAGLVGFTALSAACALAPTLATLVAARVVQGVFGAALLPVSLALVVSLYPQPRERARAIGVVAGVGGLAVAIGPVLGGALVAGYGWQSVFWLNVPIGLATVPALAAVLPSPPAPGGRLDPVGQVLFTAFAAGLTYGLIESARHGWAEPRVVTALAASAVALVLFLAFERRHASPMLPLDLVRRPAVAAASAINFLGFLALFPTLLLLTLFLQDVNGLSAVEAGVRFLALTGALTVGSLVAASAAERWGTRRVIVLASALLATGLVGLTTLRAGSGYGTYWWFLVLVGFGIPAAIAPATVAALAAGPAGLMATTSAILNTFRQFGAVVGVALCGTVLAASTGLIAGMRLAFLLAAGAAVLCAVASAFVSPSPAGSARTALQPEASTARAGIDPARSSR